MKRFNDIMDKYMKMNFFIRFLIAVPILFVFIGVFMWFLLGFTFPEINLRGHKTNIVIEFGIFLSVIFGLIISGVYESAKKSQKFWDAAKVFEEKIESIESKNELKDFFNAEYHKINDLSVSGNDVHIKELNRLYIIATTKYKYMCQK